MTVGIAPFIAVGFDGMVAVSDATENLTIPVPSAGSQVSYLILHLEYRSLTSSIANLQVIPETTWTTSVSKEFFVTFAKFTVASGSTAMTDPGVAIDYSVGDWAEKAGKSGWRAPVANAAALPDPTAVVTGPNLGNRDGDVRLALDTSVLYAWDETAGVWGAVGGALDLRDAVARADEFDNQVLRSWNGSGLVGTTNNDSLGVGRNKNIKDGVDWVIQSAVANRIDVAPIHAVVNGHLVKTAYTELTLTAPAALRHDLIYLEVWRETLASDVASETYPNDPTVTGTSTFAQLRAHLQTLLEQRTTPNIGFSKIEIIDATTIVATRWRVVSVAGVSSLSINDPLQAAITATNIDANPFTVLGTQNDQRIWRSTAPSAFDGLSWAIPLTIVRRTLSEVGPTSFILETRPDDENNRYVYDIAPRAEAGMGLVEISQGVEFGEGPTRSSSETTQLPSGWLGGFSESIVDGGAGTVRIPQGSFRVFGRTLSAPAATLAVLPAAAASGARRDLIYVEVHGTTHPLGAEDYDGPQEVARYDRQGLRTRFWLGNVKVVSVGTDSTEAAAMVTAGFTFDPVDPVAWTRTPLASEDDSLGLVWGIPVALVHRRNTLAYDPTTADGRNGTDRSGLPGLPNNAVNAPYDYEILDLRRRVIHTDGEMDAVLEESFDKLLRGELRTKFGDDVHDPGSRIAGTQILQVDRIFSGVSGGGYFSPAPAPDDRTGVWTESDEAEVLSWKFKSAAVPQADPTGVFSWNGGFPAGQLTITAPAGHHLSFDQDLAVEGNGAPGNVSALINESLSASVERNLRGGAFTFPPFSTGTDGAGNLTSVVWDVTFPGTITPAAADVYVQTWAVRPNRTTDAIYSTNESLFAIPDIVYRADLNGSRVNIGPILKTLTLTITTDLFGVGRHGFTITQAALSAAFPELGANARMYGIANAHRRGASIFDSALDYSIAFARLTDGAGSPGLLEMEVEFTSLVPSGTVDLTIMCSGDSLNQWIEITPGSKQVRGIYSWVFADLDFVAGTATHPGIAPSAEPAGLASDFTTVVPFSEVGLRPRGISAFTSSGANVQEDTTQCLAYSTLAASYEYWTDSTNLPAGWAGVPVLTAAAFEDSAATVPVNGGGYNPYLSVHSLGHAAGSPDLRVVGVGKRPLLTADDLRVFYLYTPYQGITSTLEDYLQGPVQSVGDQFLITAGIGLSHMHPRRVAISRLGNPPFSVRYGTGGSGTASSSDTGHPGATGISLSPLYRGGRTDWVRPDTEGSVVRPTDGNTFGATARLPYPFSPGGGILGSPFAEENQVDYRAILPDALGEEVSLLHLSALDAIAIPDASPWLFEDSAGVYQWRSQAGAAPPGGPPLLAFPVKVPDGFVIRGVWVDANSTGPSGFLTTTVRRRLKSSNSFTTLSTGLAAVRGAGYKEALPAFGMFPTQTTVRSDAEYWVVISPNVSNLIVMGITVGVSHPEAAFGKFIRRFNRHEVTHASGSRAGGEPLGPTSVYEEPANAIFADLESKWVSNGKVDYPLSPPRGRTLSLTAGTVEFYGSDFYGYIVGSDSLTRRDEFLNLNGSSFGNFRAASDMPKAYTTPAVSFQTLEDTSDTSYPGGIVVATPFIIKNATNEAVLGVSVGANPTSGKVAVPGSTVDAFYPAGRPVFRRGH
jgi:hypothetical protein